MSEVKKVLVVGGSRGLGRGVAVELAGRGHRVTAMARASDALQELGRSRPLIRVESGDATDRGDCERVMNDVQPDAVVVAAGIAPKMARLVDYDWDDFAAPFLVDAQLTMHWLQLCLRPPFARQGHVVVFSSGAALRGSLLSGGYAAAKQAQRFLCNYARQEAQSQGLGLRIQCLLPQLNPNTRLGAAGVAAYAERAGLSSEDFVARNFCPPLTPTIAGQEVARLISGHAGDSVELMLSGKGLATLPG